MTPKTGEILVINGPDKDAHNWLVSSGGLHGPWMPGSFAFDWEQLQSPRSDNCLGWDLLLLSTNVFPSDMITPVTTKQWSTLEIRIYRSPPKFIFYIFNFHLFYTLRSKICQQVNTSYLIVYYLIFPCPSHSIGPKNIFFNIKIKTTEMTEAQ